MNADPNTPGPDLRTLLWTSGSIADSYEVPMEAVLLHILALASALAGNLVSSKQNSGDALNARFSLIVRSEDSSVPEWMSREQQELLSHQQSVTDPELPEIYRKKPMGALRRQLRAMESIGNGNGIDAMFLRSVIDSEKRRKSYRFLLPVSGPGSEVRWKGKNPGGTPAILVNGMDDFRKLKRGGYKDGGLWSSIWQDGANGGSVLGWIASLGQEKLSKQIGPRKARSLGWQIDCPASIILPDTVVHPSLVASHVFQRLEVVRFAKTRFMFKPGPSDVKLLNQQASNLGLRLKQFPDDLRTIAVPDTLLAWHLAALFAALCWDGRNVTDPQQVSRCAELGVVLAEYVVVQHLHHFRRTFLPDHPELLEGIDRRMARLLPGHPCGVREMQRKFHGLKKDECLTSLHKLMVLGLAEESAPGRFRKMPLPQPSLRLSDFLSAYSQNLGTGCHSSVSPTDGTDNSSVEAETNLSKQTSNR